MVSKLLFGPKYSKMTNCYKSIYHNTLFNHMTDKTAKKTAQIEKLRLSYLQL